MEKSITILREEFCNQFDSLVNEYLQKMPAFIIRSAIQSADRQIEQIEKQQLEADQKAYAEAQQEQPKE
jgi:hypothetical protein